MALKFESDNWKVSFVEEDVMKKMWSKEGIKLWDMH